ncbi:DUF1654 domain-containing protein [Azorhizophilus paspali]|uniref:DUF1654 domain-containing protein n=1 Tax=Azorhizophilus paspali TaxID=69963 RepID=A0ABV6SFN4_AZOPA
MARAKRKAQTKPQGITPLERLRLRVSAMINAPKAQLERQVTIHRLDTDPDDAWEGVIELLAETDGLEMARNEDGSVTLKWDRPADDDIQVDDREEVEVVDDSEDPF